MDATYIVIALLLVAISASVFAIVPKYTALGSNVGPLSGYLLAGTSLGRLSVVSLLISSSFALNSLFYATWLGYSLGAWALLIQLSWTLSFILLSKHADKVKQHKSLHDFLGAAYGPSTRKIAGILSLIGMACLIGWEIELLRVTFKGFLSADSATSTSDLAWVITVGVVLASLLYTLVGGLRGNANADLLLNGAKSIALAVLTIVIGCIAISSTTFDLQSAVFPSPDAMLNSIGFFGLITNVVFNVVWQFVDASSWQSIIAGKETRQGDTRANIKNSGLAIFVLPGVLGTIFGIGLHSLTGVTPDSIISVAGFAAISVHAVFGFLMFVMIICCVMSLLDGMLLACAYALVVDIWYSSSSLESLDSNPIRAERILLFVRISLVLIALITSYGMFYIGQQWDITPFDYVYLVIITQLSLLGPVIVKLYSTPAVGTKMGLVILSSLAGGFVFVWMSLSGWGPGFLEAAGAWTAALSVAGAHLVSKRDKKEQGV